MRLGTIRNFSIIAHIDHGKSTLADRMLERSGMAKRRQMEDQVLDQMELERERGITIKLQPVRLPYNLNNNNYTLNLIDTPGHVDFSYEVSRSLASCEGAVLLVDATQGVQAQTLAHLSVAQKLGLVIIPVVNKIDLPHAHPEQVALEIVKLLSCKQEEVMFVSAKTGDGVSELMDAICQRVPHPSGQKNAPLRGLIFDSLWDPHLGVIVYLRVVDGIVYKLDLLRLFYSGTKAQALALGIFAPERQRTGKLEAGEIGWLATGLKDASSAKVGDTLTVVETKSPTIITPLPGYQEIKPLVWASIFPQQPADLPRLTKALEKLRLNDAALAYEIEHLSTLGSGFRIGALGSLHLEIIRERLEREFDLDLTITSPSVKYKVLLKNQKLIEIRNPTQLPDPSSIAEIKEPIMLGDFFVPDKFLGKTQKLLKSHRGILQKTIWVDESIVHLTYQIPLAETIVGLYDSFKSATSGYGSFSLSPNGFVVADLVRLDILIGDKLMPEFSQIIPRDKIERVGRKLVERIKKLIPRQLFEVKIQATHGAHIFASAKIPAFRKDVTAKLYGGDVTRKRKLLEKQKKGKKRMRQVGRINIPKDIFFKLYNG